MQFVKFSSNLYFVQGRFGTTEIKRAKQSLFPIPLKLSFASPLTRYNEKAHRQVSSEEVNPVPTASDNFPLLIDTKDLAHDIRCLLQGSIRFGALDDVWHGILIVFTGVTQRGQGLLHFVVISFFAQAI